ncbi:MAG: DMT family transporter [Lachnospiraceae bacterium]|nr:DMT family transporter [Lachnospiraceae bacterium]
MNKQEQSSQLTHSLILLLTAIIWGTSFVAQSAGMQVVGPIIYNCIRMFLGGLVLLPIIFARNSIRKSGNHPVAPAKDSVSKGILAGIILCIASNLQNIAMIDASAGKAGFMTAFYIILVPIVGIFLGKKTSFLTWVSVILALAGLYFLCIGRGGALYFAPSDLLLIGCALFFSFHILYVDRISGDTDGLTVSCTQFLVAGMISIPFIFLIDMLVLHMEPSVASLRSAWFPIAYSGFMSCGVAYTLQIIGQKGVHPTLASLIMSLESVVSAISGLIILQQKLSVDETIGCIAMFTAVILAQLPTPSKKF